MTVSPNTRRTWLVLALLFCLPLSANADLQPDWDVLLPAGDALSAGLAGVVVDAAGVTYVTGVTGPDPNLDIQTAAYAPDGALLWHQVFDGPEAWHESVGAIALGADGLLYVAGSTPDAYSVANVLVLKYDPTDGTLLNWIQYSGSGFSEGASSIAVDVRGNMFVCGDTLGDGPDAQILRFDSAGRLVWRKTCGRARVLAILRRPGQADPPRPGRQPGRDDPRNHEFVAPRLRRREVSTLDRCGAVGSDVGCKRRGLRP